MPSAPPGPVLPQEDFLFHHRRRRRCHRGRIDGRNDFVSAELPSTLPLCLTLFSAHSRARETFDEASRWAIWYRHHRPFRGVLLLPPAFSPRCLRRLPPTTTSPSSRGLLSSPLRCERWLLRQPPPSGATPDSPLRPLVAVVLLASG